MINLSRKIAITIIFLSFIANTVGAQTVYKDYKDGNVWFKVKDNYKLNSQDGASLVAPDPKNIPLDKLPFIAKIAGKYDITNLSKTFYKIKDSPTLQRTYLIQFNEIKNVDAFITDLESSGKVDYAEKVPFFKLFFTPNDPYYSQSNNPNHWQWYLHKINAAKAWDYSKGDPSVIVADVDGAIDVNHVELKDNMVAGYDFADNDNNPSPASASYFHGTYTAGLISAVSDNGKGIASIGFNIKIMPIKAVSDASQPGKIDGNAAYQGIAYAVDHDVRVINCSWGGPNTQTGKNVVDDAWSKDVIIIGAAGDANNAVKNYPAAYDHVVAVASTNDQDKKGMVSTYGSWIDVSAPGDNLLSLGPKNHGEIREGSGTSASAPLISGLCGLMLSLNPALTNQEVIDCIINTAVDIDSKNPSYAGQMGSGRIDAAAAMQCANATLGIEEKVKQNNISVYYNVENKAVLKTNSLPNGNYNILIINNLGQYIINNKISINQSNQKFIFNMRNNSNGVYILRLTNKDKQYTKKFLKF